MKLCAFLLLAAAAAWSAADPFCIIYRQTRGEFSVAHAGAGMDSALAAADTLAAQEKCTDAIDLLYAWEAAHSVDMAAQGLRAMEIDIGLDSVLAAPVKHRESRTVTHAVTVRAEYYASPSDAGTSDSIYAYPILDTVVFDTIPGYAGLNTSPWNFGAEYKYTTRDNGSLFRYGANRLALFRDYFYDQARATLEHGLFGNAVSLSLNAEATASKNNVNDSASYADMALTPGLRATPRPWFTAGAVAAMRQRRYRRQKEGYENLQSRMAGLNASVQKEPVSFSGGIETWDNRYATLLWPEKNNREGRMTLDAGLFPSDRLTASLGFTRNTITYYDKPEGPDNETISALDAAVTLANIGPCDLALNGTHEGTRYGQYDSVSYIDLVSGRAIDTVVFTRYTTAKNSCTPEIVIGPVPWLSLNGSATIEQLSASLPGSASANLVTPGEDDYFLLAWSAGIASFHEAFSASLGASFEHISYTPHGESDYRVRSLRLNGNAIYYFTKKLLASLAWDLPMPGYAGENDPADRSCTLELEYAL